MDQFRHIGEAWGSLKALMVLQDDIQINKKQCSLLLDIFSLAFNTIAGEIRQQNLRFEEKNTKWKVLDQPLKELHRIFKDGEFYIRNCLDTKEWWGKAMNLHQNKDSIEFHIHSLLCAFPAIIEAIESAGEISGLDPIEMRKKRFVLDNKYMKDWNDPQLFQWKFGNQYLIPTDFCRKLDGVWREDRWILVETIRKRMASSSYLTKNEQRLGELLMKKINGFDSSIARLYPSSILLGSKDYQVRRRLGRGSQYKEIQWLGESFGLRHFFGEISPSLSIEISSLLLLSHANIVQYVCGFYDEEKKECFLVMELMSKDLFHYIKENCSVRRRIPFPLLVAVDIMLQIARGMEYLHSQSIFHGDLNPSNVLIKGRTPSSSEGYFHTKVSGFGLSSVKNKHFHPDGNEDDSVIWHAPEVLQEESGNAGFSRFTEKADVYSFSMICFELLTGKIPFEDSHLHGAKMSQNIRAGERPLFPYSSPKYLVNLTRRCWHSDPSQRPSFSSIVRFLRFIKQFLVMNQNQGMIELPTPPVDVWELEMGFIKKFPIEAKAPSPPPPVWQIPFQMFAYRLIEKEKTLASVKDNRYEESISEAAPASICGDEAFATMEDPFMHAASDKRSVCTEAPDKRVLSIRRSAVEGRLSKSPGTPKGQSSTRPSPLIPCGRSMNQSAGRNLTPNSRRGTKQAPGM